MLQTQCKRSKEKNIKNEAIIYNPNPQVNIPKHLWNRLFKKNQKTSSFHQQKFTNSNVKTDMSNQFKQYTPIHNVYSKRINDITNRPKTSTQVSRFLIKDYKKITRNSTKKINSKEKLKKNCTLQNCFDHFSELTHFQKKPVVENLFNSKYNDWNLH